MGENNSESAISPVGTVSQPEVKKSPLWKRVLRLAPKEVRVPDITPAAQTTDFASASQTPAPETSPVNADAPEFSTAPSTPIDVVVNKVDADLTAQMAAHVSNFVPGSRPPEVASGLGTPTNPPTETATASPMAAEAGAVAPTPIRTENPLEPPTPTALTEKPAA